MNMNPNIDINTNMNAFTFGGLCPASSYLIFNITGSSSPLKPGARRHEGSLDNYYSVGQRFQDSSGLKLRRVPHEVKNT